MIRRRSKESCSGFFQFFPERHQDKFCQLKIPFCVIFAQSVLEELFYSEVAFVDLKTRTSAAYQEILSNYQIN